MKRMTILTIILSLILTLCACGSEKAPETAPATAAPATVPAENTVSEPLDLTGWDMSASTWSSPNGATIHISATPNQYTDGQSAAFIVRLENDEVANVPCQWDGTVYTASADLNAADGYCYYVALTAADGTITEVAVNTPNEPVNEAFINMESALLSYCALTVEESAFEGSKLVLTSGSAQVQVPTITDDGAAITCQKASLVLSFNGEELATAELPVTASPTAGLFEAKLSNISFDVPEMEDDQQLDLTLHAVLSNGQELSAFGGNWIYNAEDLLAVFG